MTGFYVHGIETGFFRQQSRLPELFLQTFQIIVTDNAAIVRRTQLLILRMSVGNQVGEAVEWCRMDKP